MNIDALATVLAGLFAGGASFISLVEHPARLRCGTEFAIREFRPSFRRAHLIMASLALASFAAGVAAWAQGSGMIWLIGGLAMVANGPFTMALIRPINIQLLDPNLDIASAKAAALIVHWGRFHSVRSLLGCAGFVLFVVGLARH